MTDWTMLSASGDREWFTASELVDLITDTKSWCSFANMVVSGNPALMTIVCEGQPPEQVKVIRASKLREGSCFERPYG